MFIWLALSELAEVEIGIVGQKTAKISKESRASGGNERIPLLKQGQNNRNEGIQIPPLQE